MNKLNQKLYKISFLLLFFLTICLLCTKLLFYFGGKESKYLFLVYIAVSVITRWLLCTDSVKDKISNIIGFIIVLSGTIFLNINVFDYSYDGIGYHEMGIGLLAHGWNPIKESADVFIANSRLNLLGNSHAVWIDHYASGTWTIASIFYAFTGYIESGKAINLLSIFILFGMINYYFARWKNHYKGYNYVFAFLCTVNPITLSQLFTNYVDGTLILFLELGILSWFVILKEEEKQERLKGVFLLFCSILFCSNIKVTGLFFIGVYTIAAFIIILVYCFKKNKKEFKGIAIRLTAILGAMVLFSVCIIGYAPCMTNLVQHSNPVYPILSEKDILAGQNPISFEGMGNTQKAIISLFSKVDNINVNVDREPALKIPFSISKSEIEQCFYGTTIAGFGPWFSGILIVSLIYLFWIFVIQRKERQKESIDIAKVYFIVVILVSAGLTLFFEGSWWARFSMYEYFIPLAMLYLLGEDKGLLKVIICLLFVVNNFFFCRNYIDLFRSSEYLRTNLNYVSDISKEEEIEISLSMADWSGSQFNLMDYGVVYSITNDEFEGGGICWGYSYRMLTETE